MGKRTVTFGRSHSLRSQPSLRFDDLANQFPGLLRAYQQLASVAKFQLNCLVAGRDIGLAPRSRTDAVAAVFAYRIVLNRCGRANVCNGDASPAPKPLHGNRKLLGPKSRHEPDSEQQ